MSEFVAVVLCPLACGFCLLAGWSLACSYYRWNSVGYMPSEEATNKPGSYMLLVLLSPASWPGVWFIGLPVAWFVRNVYH